jgi:hypothetical protein
MRWCCGVLIAAAATTGIQPEHDETTTDHQHNRSPGRTHQHPTVHRTIDMSDAAARR